MTPFAPDQYIILALVFVLGLVLGMYLLAGGKWKKRYREETRHRAELEAENKRLGARVREMDALRGGDEAHPVDDPAHHAHPHPDPDPHPHPHPVTASEAQPVRRRGGLWGLGRGKH